MSHSLEVLLHNSGDGLPRVMPLREACTCRGHQDEDVRARVIRVLCLSMISSLGWYDRSAQRSLLASLLVGTALSDLQAKYPGCEHDGQEHDPTYTQGGQEQDSDMAM